MFSPLPQLSLYPFEFSSSKGLLAKETRRIESHEIIITKDCRNRLSIHSKLVFPFRFPRYIWCPLCLESMYSKSVDSDLDSAELTEPTPNWSD
jgi:hypothetical protein